MEFITWIDFIIICYKYLAYQDDKSREKTRH